MEVDKGGFTIQYDTPNSGVQGDYIQDKFGIGGMTIMNLTMAVATAADYVNTGIMGIGFDTDESIARSSDESTVYPNLVDELFDQNLITSHSYSLWLDDLGMFSIFLILVLIRCAKLMLERRLG